MVNCWAEEPESRPNIAYIREIVRKETKARYTKSVVKYFIQHITLLILMNFSLFFINNNLLFIYIFHVYILVNKLYFT